MNHAPQPPVADVIVLGAGLTGLGIAHALRGAGRRVVVVDAAARAGGAVRTVRRDGWVVETGPNTFQVEGTWLEELAATLGLAGEVVEADPAAHRRYLVRGGRLVATPEGPLDAVRSPIFSWQAKLGVPLELLRPRRDPALGDESLAGFVTRRLGREFLDRAIDPLANGIYAGDPARLSVKHAFPRVAALEANHGGLIRGAVAKLRAAKAARKAGKAPSKRRMVGVRGGLDRLVAALAAPLGDDLALGARVVALEPAPAGGPARWLARLDDGRAFAAREVVLAVPAFALPALPLPSCCAAGLAPFGEIVHPPVATVALGFRREAVRHPLDGFGFLAPGPEGRSILGTLFPSALFPDRAPAGRVLTTTFVGGRRRPELAEGDDATILARVMPELVDLLGLDPRAEPELVEITRWPRAIAQPEVGHDRFLEAATAFEHAHPGLHLAGGWRTGVAAPACLQAGLALGARLAGA